MTCARNCRTRAATLIGVENALYSGKGFGRLLGDDGDNYLKASTVVGRGGNDTLEGSVADYTAEAQPRTLSRAGDAWLVRAASEVDTVRVQELRLGSGDDEMLGEWHAGDGLRLVLGGAGNDRLVGFELRGGLGDDTLVGGLANYIDSPGPVAVSTATMTSSGADGNDVLVGITAVRGSAFGDTFNGGATGDYFDAGAGNDTVDGGSGNDTLIGGQGADLLRGGDGNDQIDADNADTVEGGAGDDMIRLGDAPLTRVDGGTGTDLLVVGWFFGGVREVNLRAGTYQSPPIDGTTFTGTVRGVEAVRSASDFPSKLTGLDGPAHLRGETLISGGASDTIDGGSGINMFVLSRRRSDYLVELGATGLPERVRYTASVRDNLLPTQGSVLALSVDELSGIERLRFADSVLAFGDRAVEVAKVAFALWSPAIATSETLFGKGIDWYDAGLSYRELIDFALGYYTALGDTAFAQNLVNNVPGVRSVAEVLALMAQQGGGQAGRAFVTQLFADAPGNAAAIELAGLRTNGIVASLMFDDSTLFPVPGA